MKRRLSFVLAVIMFFSLIFVPVQTTAKATDMPDSIKKISTFLLREMDVRGDSELIPISIWLKAPTDEEIEAMLPISHPDETSTMSAVQAYLSAKRKVQEQVFSSLTSEFTENHLDDKDEVYFQGKFIPNVMVSVPKYKIALLAALDDVTRIDSAIDYDTPLTPAVEDPAVQKKYSAYLRDYMVNASDSELIPISIWLKAPTDEEIEAMIPISHPDETSTMSAVQAYLSAKRKVQEQVFSSLTSEFTENHLDDKDEVYFQGKFIPNVMVSVPKYKIALLAALDDVTKIDSAIDYDAPLVPADEDSTVLNKYSANLSEYMENASDSELIPISIWLKAPTDEEIEAMIPISHPDDSSSSAINAFISAKRKMQEQIISALTRDFVEKKMDDSDEIYYWGKYIPNVIADVFKPRIAEIAALEDVLQIDLAIGHNDLLMPLELCEHEYMIEVTEPTCTENGYTTYTCALCGDSYVASEVAAPGHDYQNGVCTRCGEADPDFVPPANYDALNKAITEAEKLYMNDYTSASADAVYSALFDARAALESDSQQEVDAAAKALNDAVAALVVRPVLDFTEVNELAARVDAVNRDRGRYTEDSLKEFDRLCMMTALDDLVMEEEQEAIDYAAQCLRDALAALVEKHVHDYAAVVTAPTCTAAGYTTHTCDCGDSYVDSEVPAPGHSFGAWTASKAATCTDKGEETRACARCDAKETRELAALGHDYKAAVTAPTCTVAGFTTHTCSRCGDKYTDSTTVALGHSFGAWAVSKASTCTEKGQETRTCARCDEVETREVAALGHDYQTKVTAPTCTDAGFTVHTCAHCGSSYTDSTTAALGHDYGDWAVSKPSTCTEKGQETRACIRCHAKETREIGTLGHNFKDGVCARCGEADPDFVPPVNYDALNKAIAEAEKLDMNDYTGVSWDAVYSALFDARAALASGSQLEVDAAAKALNDAVAALVVRPVLDFTEVNELAARVDAVNRDRGRYTEESLKEFDRLCMKTSIDDLEMDEEQEDIDYAAQCLRDALAALVEKQVHVHDYKAVVTAPTCTAAGYTTHTCDCGDSYVDSEVPAPGHSFGAWTASKAATCTDKGEETRACARCDAKETRELAALGHDYKAAVTAPTCTVAGFTTHTCSRCGDKYTDSTTVALGHSFGAWAVSKASTCTEKGQETRTCARCDEVETREVAALGHDYQTKVTAPTCTDAGFTVHTCAHCGSSYTDSTTAALGHDYGDWAVSKPSTCTEKGQETRACIRCHAKETREIGTLGHNFKDGVCARCGEADPDFVPPVNYDALNKAIAEAEKLDMNDYTGVSWDAVYSALFDARAALASGSQLEVDAAAKALNDAVAALVVRPVLDFTEVNELAARVDAVNRDRGRYTEESLKEFDRLCMKTSIDDLEMDEEQEDIDYAAQCLRDALAALVEKQVHVHDYKAVVTAPTCIAAGYTTYTCTCGDSYKDEIVPALGHNYNTVVTDPSCVENGYTTYTCTRCGDEYVDNEKAALGHVFKDGICTRCGEAKDPDYEEPVIEPFRFDDVRDDKAFYFAPVYWAVEQKITKGTSEKLFSPDDGCTRGQVVTFLWRAAGEPEPTKTENPFKDVKETDFFYKAVLWAVEKGISKGTSADKFSPDATCTRAQIVTFLYRAEGTPEIAKKSKPFHDVDEGRYYADAVAWAVENGVTTGKSADTFAPEATCTRAEVVTFLYRSYTGPKPQNPDTAGGPPVYYTASSVEELTQWIKTAEVEPSYTWGSLYPFLKAARDLGQILAVHPASEDYSLQEILVQCNREQMDYFFIKGNERLEVLVELPGTDGNPKLSLDERVGQINSDLALEYESLQYAKASATVNGKETDVYYYDGGEYTKKGSEQKELFGPSAFFEYEGHEVLIRGIGSLYGCKWDSTYLDLFQFDFVELE